MFPNIMSLALKQYFSLILIFDTLILDNEIVSFEIMIVPIENNSSFVSKSKSSFSFVSPSSKS